MSGKRVLLIEDDVKIAQIVQRGLHLKGLEVVVAEDGVAGRAAWRDGAFDLVLLDVMLPELDGITLCAEQRRAGDTTPVIMLTARSEEEVRARSAAAGANGYISKPFAYAELVQAIFRCLPPPTPAD